jgi:hypothetical protein
MPWQNLLEPAPHSCNDRCSNHDRSSRAVSRSLADSPNRLAPRTARRKIACGASCHSPIRISCRASQGETEHGVRRVGDIWRRSAEVISAVRIVSVPFHFFRWNENVFPIFSALGVDVAIDVLDFGRIAVRIVAAAGRWMVGHMPCRIEFLVQGHILRWMVPRGMIFCFLCVNCHHQHAAETDA